jgi:hypothetical protein
MSLSDVLMAVDIILPLLSLHSVTSPSPLTHLIERHNLTFIVPPFCYVPTAINTSDRDIILPLLSLHSVTSPSPLTHLIERHNLTFIVPPFCYVPTAINTSDRDIILPLLSLHSVTSPPPLTGDLTEWRDNIGKIMSLSDVLMAVGT